jgi:hypothetical protein
MKTIISILTVAFLAVTPAAAMSAKELKQIERGKDGALASIVSAD